ncbi:hypothetical protein D8Y22_08365 [Salinadaptatus halalkaliphilus]|uniref:CARDB domain-containing protein n=1 Tax=Salinadaptatus halalkaliphilus TaxID=2419781 RepID=A0A4V3VLD3_9EURY|nr:CARDB domain-containing protein [Salinadaptatus halalkaliphilus]THE65217.1 hypothetical protein D8Y22_08365 [Salinadaptatus halalkaliphilus]
MPSTKVLATTIAVCVLCGLVVPTAALAVGEDAAANEVTLEPVDDRYATIEDDELRLDLGVYDHAVTTIVSVFTITVGEDASTIEEIWIDHDVDGIQFAIGGEEVTADSPIEPSPGETITVGLTVDTATNNYDESETFTVHVAYEDDEDDGDEEADDGDDADSGGGGGGDSGGQTGDEQPSTEKDEPAAVIDQIDLEAAPTDVETGETVTVTATYENTGNITGERTVELTEDGVAVASETIELGPEETETVSFEWYADAAGEYDLAVDDELADSITVTDPGPMALEDRDLSGPATAALAPPAALSILALGIAARRRWDQIGRVR